MYYVKYFYCIENLKLILVIFNNNFNCFGVMWWSGFEGFYRIR